MPSPASPPPPPAAARALVLPSGGAPQLLRSPARVGRDPARADVVLADPTVSGLHAELARDDVTGLWRLRDLGGRNGTFVDGVRITDSAPLAGCHQLGFGSAQLRFVLDVPVRLTGGAGGRGRIERGTAGVELDADELGFLQAIVAAGEAVLGRSGIVDGYVRMNEVAARFAPGAPTAADEVRALGRRLERKLTALGEPPVLECCSRRGYRLRGAAR